MFTLRFVSRRVTATVRAHTSFKPIAHKTGVVAGVVGGLRLLSSSSSSSSSSWGQSSSPFSICAGFGLGVAATAVLVSAEAAQSSQVNYDEVRADIEAALEMDENHDDGSFGPILVRLAWHSSGSYSCTDNDGGSNGAKMRFKPECAWGANAGLALARGVLEPIQKKHPGLTFADLYTLAGVVSIEAMGGPSIQWRPGRVDEKDGSTSPPDGRLPDASQGAQHLRNIFYRMGFNDQEIVALSGAHALGRCHTTSSGYSGPWSRSPTTFSNEYFRLLLEEKWTVKKWKGPKQYENKSGELMMLPTDMVLLDDSQFKKWVDVYADDEERFFNDFAAAFLKLMELGVEFPQTGFLKRLFEWFFSLFNF